MDVVLAHFLAQSGHKERAHPPFSGFAPVSLVDSLLDVSHLLSKNTKLMELLGLLLEQDSQGNGTPGIHVLGFAATAGMRAQRQSPLFISGSGQSGKNRIGIGQGSDRDCFYSVSMCFHRFYLLFIGYTCVRHRLDIFLTSDRLKASESNV